MEEGKTMMETADVPAKVADKPLDSINDAVVKKRSKKLVSDSKPASLKTAKQGISPPASKVKAKYDPSADISEAFNQFGKRKGLTAGELKVFLVVKKGLEPKEATAKVKTFLTQSIKKGTMEEVDEGIYKTERRGVKSASSAITAARKRKIISPKTQRKSKSPRRRKKASPKKARKSSKKGRSDKKSKTSQRRKPAAK